MKSEALAAAVERIAASQTFVRAGRAVRLLRHVTEMAAAGRSEAIKEYSLAVDVFDRTTYDPKIDSVVRVEAGRLRKLLARYYEEEGKNETLRIEIPKGSYAPVIVETPAATAPVPAPRFVARAALAGLAALLVACGVWVLAAGPRHSYPASGPLPLAVLPFADMSPAKDQGYISDGLTEELIEFLSSVDGLKVTSRTSAFAYHGKEKDVRVIGEELKVRAVLEGSVRQQGNRIRVTVQLINTEDGFHLWSETFDRDVSDVFAMEQEIAKEVAKTFNRFLSGTRQALIRPRTRNPEAWHYYLRAVSMDSTGPEDQAKAIELFKSAVAADPGYAMAWAKLAQTLVTRVDWGDARGADAYPIAADAARRSLEIDPNLAEAHEATALVKILQDHDWAGSEEAFRRAIHLDPNDAMLRYEYGHLVLSTSGRQGAAIEQFQRSLAIDSGPVTYRNGLASAFLKDHRCSDAEAQSTLAHKLARSSISPLVYLGMAAECQGRHEEALGRYQEAAAKLRSGWVLGHFAQTLIRLDRRDEARKLLAEMQAPRSGPVPLVDIATVYTALGEKARALDALEQAYTDMAPQMLWLKVEDRFDGLRNEPRFTMLMNKMGFVTSR